MIKRFSVRIVTAQTVGVCKVLALFLLREQKSAGRTMGLFLLDIGFICSVIGSGFCFWETEAIYVIS